MTWNVLSWSRGHELKPRSGRTGVFSRPTSVPSRTWTKNCIMWSQCNDSSCCGILQNSSCIYDLNPRRTLAVIYIFCLWIFKAQHEVNTAHHLCGGNFIGQGLSLEGVVLKRFLYILLYRYYKRGNLKLGQKNWWWSIRRPRESGRLRGSTVEKNLDRLNITKFHIV